MNPSENSNSSVAVSRDSGDAETLLAELYNAGCEYAYVRAVYAKSDGAPRHLDSMSASGLKFQELKDHLGSTLTRLREEHAALVAQKNGAYLERNRVVAALARMVLIRGGDAGTKRTVIEGWSEDWHGCVYIDTPWGQASWHYHDSQAYLFADLPPYADEWDGHSTDEKYTRLHNAFDPITAARRVKVMHKELLETSDPRSA